MPRPLPHLLLPALPMAAGAALACLAGGALAATPQQPQQKQAAGPEWQQVCQDGPRGRFCALTLEERFPENRGGSGRVTVSVRRDADCTSLHVGFDRAIDLARPVTMQVDGGPAEGFYTGDELNELARAVDSGEAPGGVRPEFAAFWREVAAGSLGDASAAARELVARFARVKNADRLGVACPVADRLLPRLLAARSLRLTFHVDTGRPLEVYHWPALNRREVTIPLERLAAALDALPSAR